MVKDLNPRSGVKALYFCVRTSNSPFVMDAGILVVDLNLQSGVKPIHFYNRKAIAALQCEDGNS